MKRIAPISSSLGLLLGLLALPLAALADADAVTGIWLTAPSKEKAGPGSGYVQIYERDGKYHGRIVGSPDGESRKDKHNPDPAKRDRLLLGVRILEGFEYAGEGEGWTGGHAYDPNSGKAYKGKMWLEGSGTLKLRGYIGISLLGRTETWTRVGEDVKGLEKDALVAPGGE